MSTFGQRICLRILVCGIQDFSFRFERVLGAGCHFVSLGATVPRHVHSVSYCGMNFGLLRLIVAGFQKDPLNLAGV